MASTADDLNGDFSQALAAESNSALGRVNIALYGATGAGKSSLVNAIFGADVAPTGIGEPVTAETALYVNSTGTLGIYDGAGFELGGGSLSRNVLNRIKGNRRSRAAVGDYIHVAWFCVNSGTARLEPAQVAAVRAVADSGIPIVLVLTKVSVRGDVVDPAVIELADKIAAMELPIVGARPVLTASVEDAFNGTHRYGLEDLLTATYGVVPEAQRVAMAAAQKIDLSIKARYARSWIAGAVAFAGGVGFTPIPLADAAVLAPAQAALMAKIATIYDIPRERAVKLVAEATGAMGVGGRMAAASLAKMVPGAGNVISAGVAATITGTIGEAWRGVSERVFTGKIDLDDAEEMASIAQQFIQRVRGPGTVDQAENDASASLGPSSEKTDDLIV